jgi:hypothetical protein
LRTRLEATVAGNLLLDDRITAYVWFVPKALDTEYLRGDSGWTSSKQFLLFDSRRWPARLDPHRTDCDFLCGEERRMSYPVGEGQPAKLNERDPSCPEATQNLTEANVDGNP